MLNMKRVRKKYGKTHALKDITLTIPKGVSYGLVGPNGAGKSTLMKIVASVIHDYDGNLQFREKGKAFKQKIGYVPQEICLEPTVSAYSNIVFFGKLYGLKGNHLRDRVSKVLEEIGLTERAADKVHTFSGGMKRRLNIGCALMHHPELIIMDEPTVGIDPQSRAFIFQLIENMKEQGCTIIYASHYMEEVEQLCDEIAFLDHGKIIEQGRIEELLQKYAIPAIFIKGIGISNEKIAALGVIENKNGGILLKTEHPLTTMGSVIEVSKREKWELERMELVLPRLENVFMNLTGSALRD